MVAKNTESKVTTPVKEKVSTEVLNLQFPSADGHNDVEVAKRSQDVSDPTAVEHRKVFVLVKRVWDGRDDKEEMHQNNIRATRSGLINQGLRPLEDGRFIGAEDHADGVSIELTYAVKAVAAAIAEGETEHPHVSVEDETKE